MKLWRWRSPASRYSPSPHGVPEPLPTIEYGPTAIVRKVQAPGEVSYRGHHFRLSNAFRGYPVALRPTPHDGLWRGSFVINLSRISIYITPLNKAECVTHVPEHLLPMSPVRTAGEGWGEGDGRGQE